MAISHATESISSNWKSMKSDWDLKQGVSSLSLEDSLLSSSVYQRVSRYELEGSNIGQGLPNTMIASANGDARCNTPDFPAGSGPRQRSEPPLDQIPPLGGSWITPENHLNPSPNASVSPSVLSETDRTIGQESRIRLLPTRQARKVFGLPSGLMAVQPGLMPFEQPGLIPDELKHEARNGLIPANRNRLPAQSHESSIATSTQSLVLSLGWNVALLLFDGADVMQMAMVFLAATAIFLYSKCSSRRLLPSNRASQLENFRAQT